MANVFLGWCRDGITPIKAELDSSISRLVDIPPAHRIIVPKGSKIGHGWRACWHPSSSTYYVQRKARVDGKLTTEYLHRFLKGLQMKDAREIDHADGCGLNNADANLSVVTKAEHHRLTRERRSANWRTGLVKAWSKSRAASSTGFYGVSRHRSGFVANVHIPGQGKQIYLGKHDTVLLAAKAANDYLKQFDASDSRLNKDPQTGEIL